ncbi:MAG TPA: hypothetical protein VES73_16765 [Lamprocystis sp. (in: g-proteobacteria)]|nr:hypothetical protein [Lamprocystis sp. (in: g-proteobacteria)]
MNNFLRGITAVALFAGLGLATQAAWAEQCFLSEQALNVDAQTIRQRALGMGWEVSKTASLTAAGLVSAKATLYPKDPIEICIKEEGDRLLARAQSKASDAGQADWHDLYASKK